MKFALLFLPIAALFAVFDGAQVVCLGYFGVRATPGGPPWPICWAIMAWGYRWGSSWP